MRPRSAALAVFACCSTLSTTAATTAAGTAATPRGAAGATAASSVGSAGVHLNVLAVLRRVLPGLERRSGVPIRVPRTVYVFARTRVYATVTASADAHDVELGFAPGCGGATVCFAASFSGRRGGRASGRKAVRLGGGIVGRFTPSSCGASCAPPEIQWVEHGVRYGLQLYGRLGSDRATLVAYADSAIGHPALY